MVETALENANPPQARPALEKIWGWLSTVFDPEIPVLSVVDLGIVRDVAWDEENQTCTVTLTPTYSGCPATAVIQSNVRKMLIDCGIPRVQVQVRLSPPWTTEWLSPLARETLRGFGIAPPAGPPPRQSTAILPVIDLATASPSPACPHCGSTRTSAISQFGSTLCKSLYRCENCREPFEYFKPH